MATASSNTKNHRFIDVNEEPRKFLQPIEGYKDLPLVTLEEAIEPLVKVCPDVRRRAYIAKANFDEPEELLTSDEAASIYLYTSEWAPREECVYVALNNALRSKNRNRLLPPWLLYLKLFLTALYKLEPFNGTLWRGVRLDLQQQYEVGKTYTWWGFSSCTESLPVLKLNDFLGEEGKRTVFSIKCFDGRKIRHFSAIEEEEEILLLPATQFIVKSNCQLSKKDPDLIIIEIEQVKPPHVLLEPPSSTASPIALEKPKPKPIEPTVEKKIPKPNHATVPKPMTPPPPPPPVPPKKEYKEFADPGTYDKLFCKGRACARCKKCRDWTFKGDRETWNWLANWKSWKDSDWKRYNNEGIWNLFTKRDGATCHFDDDFLCFCDDHFVGS